MDNMAYLQQIASGGDSSTKKPGKNNFLFEKVLTLRNGIIALVCVVILIIVLVITSAATSTVDNKDQELLANSCFQATYLINTLDTYQKNLKSSTLRGMSSSLNGVLKEITLTEGNLLQSEYGVELKKLEKSSLSDSEKKRNNELNIILENGRLNGLLDRTFAREITMQIAYLISYQSECAARTSSSKVVEATNKAKANLENLYDQFKNYQDLSS